MCLCRADWAFETNLAGFRGLGLLRPLWRAFFTAVYSVSLADRRVSVAVSGNVLPFLFRFALSSVALWLSDSRVGGVLEVDDSRDEREEPSFESVFGASAIAVAGTAKAIAGIGSGLRSLNSANPVCCLKGTP
jgi:hypothetical protein